MCAFCCHLSVLLLTVGIFSFVRCLPKFFVVEHQVDNVFLNYWYGKVLLLLLLLLLSHFSRVWLCATPETAAHQAPPSLGFSRQDHWSGLPFPSPMHESEKWKWSHSVVSSSSRPHGLQLTRLLCPWDFPGKSTGVGCHHLDAANFFFCDCGVLWIFKIVSCFILGALLLYLNTFRFVIYLKSIFSHLDIQFLYVPFIEKTF